MSVPMLQPYYSPFGEPRDILDLSAYRLPNPLLLTPKDLATESKVHFNYYILYSLSIGLGIPATIDFLYLAMIVHLNSL